MTLTQLLALMSLLAIWAQQMSLTEEKKLRAFDMMRDVEEALQKVDVP